TYLDNFEEEKPSKEIEKIFSELEKEGIKCYYGRWFQANDAKLILLETNKFREIKVNEIKKQLWEDYKIDSLNTGFDYDEPLAWSYAAGMLIERMIEIDEFKKKNIVAHFHEWLSGAGLLYLKKRNLPIGLVFTTHATRIGRAKSGSGENLIEEVTKGLREGKFFDDKESYKYGLQAQHMVELNSTKEADIFTTVSDVVREEAKYILKRNAEVVVPNALDLSGSYSTRSLTIMHEKYRKKINKFLEAYFLPYYPVRMKDNIVIFISGRYEFLNKGIDLFIHSLKKLNERLKKRESEKTVFAFILIPSGIKGPKTVVLENMIQYQKMVDLVRERLNEIEDNVVSEMLHNKKIDIEKIMGKEFFTKMKILSNSFIKLLGKNPPLCAYELDYDEKDDMILNELKKCGLENRQDDKVKVIFYPTYLSSSDGLLGMEYDDFVVGSSVGVFPSRYEPWGYTPFETAVLRTLSVTTDVSGFGAFMMKNVPTQNPIKVLHTIGRSTEDIVEELADALEFFVFVEREERTRLKIRTREVVDILDWKIQAENYFKAHRMAVKRMLERVGGK
ncbi:MAG: glycogen/starch synthase, partial [Candidatus Aenigmatarchaeota archaeon]